MERCIIRMTMKQEVPPRERFLKFKVFLRFNVFQVRLYHEELLQERRKVMEHENTLRSYNRSKSRCYSQ